MFYGSPFYLCGKVHHAQCSFRLHIQFGPQHCGGGLAECARSRQVQGIQCGNPCWNTAESLRDSELAGKGYDISALTCKNWERYSAPSAPIIHLLITVCAYAALEKCPVNMENGIKVHWEIEDPTITQGSVEMKRLAFETIYRQISEKVTALVDIPLNKLDQTTARRVLRRIGCI